MSLCCLVPAESAPRGDKLSASVTKGKKNKEGKESRSNKVQSGSRPSSQVNLFNEIKKEKLVQSPALMNLKGFCSLRSHATNSFCFIILLSSNNSTPANQTGL